MITQNSILKRTIPIVMQCAEAHRKPRWLPVAKSKIYRIPKRPEIPEEERRELMRLHNHYKTQMRAIRRFYHEDMIKEKSTLGSASSEMSMKLEAEEWVRCTELNDKWNTQVAAEREERCKQEMKEFEKYALERMETMDRKQQKLIDSASEEIRKQKELSKTFITPETLEGAIDNAIANPVDYNFAIDSRGNVIHGRETTFIEKEEKAASANA